MVKVFVRNHIERLQARIGTSSIAVYGKIRMRLEYDISAVHEKLVYAC